MYLNRLPDDRGGVGAQGIIVSDAESDVVICSICLEPAARECDRTVVELKCNHTFHLDCIGSAFNAKGRMECPNCRSSEIGEWMFGNGNVLLPSLEERNEEIVSQTYSPQMLTLQWSPYNDVTPAPMHLHCPPSYFPQLLFSSNRNGGSYFASNYTHASVQLNWPSVSANPFPALQSLNYQGMQAGGHAGLLSLQQYFQLSPYSVPPVPPSVGTTAEQLVSVSGNGLPQYISPPNLGARFSSHPQIAPMQNFARAGFLTPTNLHQPSG